MKVILKKSWRSPRGKLYPAGTIFIKEAKTSFCQKNDGAWYKFNIPFKSHGFVFFLNSIFNKETSSSLALKSLRKAEMLNHLRKAEPHPLTVPARIIDIKANLKRMLEAAYSTILEDLALIRNLEMTYHLVEMLESHLSQKDG